MKVTHYGHATILLETEKAKLLFRPFYHTKPTGKRH